jgi:hypothetical protein
LKTGPNALIGYGARLSFIPGDPKDFHDKLLRQGWWDALGPAFQYSELQDKINEALKKIEDGEAAYDQEALNMMLHGLSPSEGAELLEPLDWDFDFNKFTGGPSINPSDVGKSLAAVVSSDLMKDFRSEINAVNRFGSTHFRDFAIKLANTYEFRFQNVVF